MLRSFQSPNHQYYSPFVTGCVTTFMMYIGLALYGQSGVKLPNWWWLLGLPILIIGVALQFLSRRVLWIRSYQAISFLMFAIVYAGLLWILLVYHQNEGNKLLAILSLIIVVTGCILINIQYRKTNFSWTNMPHGPVGILNTKTGLVDPTRSPKRIHESWEKAESRINMIGRLSPLIAGVVMFLIRVLSESSFIILLAIMALLGVIGGIAGFIGAVSYTVSILRWEREHKKRIYVTR